MLTAALLGASTSCAFAPPKVASNPLTAVKPDLLPSYKQYGEALLSTTTDIDERVELIGDDSAYFSFEEQVRL